MGHREDVWTNPLFHNVLSGGLRWAMGDAPADTTPNIRKVAPGAWSNPPFPTPKPAAKPTPKPAPIPNDPKSQHPAP